MWMCDARNKVLLASALGGALLFSAAALAAGTYDGTWTGKETTGGCAGTVVTITVANNIASPYMSGTHASSFHGKPIHSDGTVSWISTNTGRHTTHHVYRKYVHAGYRCLVRTSVHYRKQAVMRA